MLRLIIWLMGLLIFGRKKKNGKPGMTLPMVIAKAHNLSVQFAGLQMAAAYLAAVTISCISVVIGMCHQIVVSQPTWKPALAYPIGFIVGGLAAFIFDGLTIASLKRMKTVPFGLNTITGFNLFFVAGGITFSTLAGDQMWALIFPSGLLSPVFAVGVSAVLIATEMWPKQHEQAVKKSVARGDVLTFALSEESDEHIENLSRDNRVNLLSSPQFQADLNADTSDIVKQILIDKYKQQITPITPKVTEIVESDLQQLPSPQDVKLLPAHVSHSDEHKLELALDALHQTPEITDEGLQAILGTKTPAAARFWRLKANEVMEQNVNAHPDKNLTKIVMVEEEHPDVTSLISLPLLDVTAHKTTESQVKNDDATSVTDTQNTLNASSQSSQINTSEQPDNVNDRTPNTGDLPQPEPTTNPLPKLTRKRVTRKYADGLDPIIANKIVTARNKLTARGVNATHQVIADEAGIKSRQTVSKYLRALAQAEEK